MRNIFLLVIVLFALGSSVVRVQAAPQYDPKAERQQRKVRHKEEWKVLKFQQKLQKESMKSSSLPKSTRAQMKHRMARERRELRERQKDERQDYKDLQRQIKDMQDIKF